MGSEQNETRRNKNTNGHETRRHTNTTDNATDRRRDKRGHLPPEPANVPLPPPR